MSKQAYALYEIDRTSFGNAPAVIRGIALTEDDAKAWKAQVGAEDWTGRVYVALPVFVPEPSK